MSQTIPLAALEQYPASVAATSESEAPISSLRDLTRFDVQRRATLTDAIVADLNVWSAPPSAVAAAQRLRETGTYAVITGQQAGIGTGPLYTLYKAVGALRMARDLQAEHPEHAFVAVFWIEGDDHDFDEARVLGVVDRSGTTRTIAYEDRDALPRHVGDRTVERASFENFLGELRATLIETEFTSDAIGILERAYDGESATFTSGFARCMYAMLGDVPLVVVSSRNARLKWLARDVFEKEARSPETLYDALVARTAELSASGAATPITPKRGGLFMTHDHTRRAIDASDDAYTLRDVGTRFTREELAALAKAEPERFSPNVALRPIVQDAVFPTAAYIGGPSELAYLQQISSAYGAFDIAPPAFVQRPFVLLMEPKVRRVLESAGVSLQEVMRSDFNATAHVIDEEKDGEIEQLRARTITSAREALNGFEALTKQIDPTLEKALGATGASVEKSIDDFAKRLRSALKRKSQTDIDRLEAARELVLPGRELQERTLNATYYINKYGLDRVQQVLEAVDTATGALQVVDI